MRSNGRDLRANSKPCYHTRISRSSTKTLVFQSSTIHQTSRLPLNTPQQVYRHNQTMSSAPEPQIFPVLKGKVALITGGAQGMGKATCEVFLRAGAKVVTCDVKDEGVKVVDELSYLGDIHFVKADISKSQDIQRLIDETVTKFGRLDAAVNNAAKTPDRTAFVDFDEDYWRSIVDINLTGTALCCKYEMQQMIKQGDGGTIVNIASINAFRPQPNMPAYTAAKHALLGVTKHASMEGGPHKIRVNAIAPGAIYVSP